MNLFQHLPQDQYNQEPSIVEFQQAIEKEGVALGYAVEDFFLQLSPHTATWGLSFYEEEYGIQPDEQKPLTLRRERLLAKMRGRGTTSKSLLKIVTSSFYNGEVEIREHSEENWFELIFISHDGIPERLDDLKEIISEIVPAHLGFEFTILFNTHAYLSQFPHEFLAGYTHDELRIKRLDSDWEQWVNAHNTHENLEQYTHSYLSQFTHDKIRSKRPL